MVFTFDNLRFPYNPYINWPQSYIYLTFTPVPLFSVLKMVLSLTIYIVCIEGGQYFCHVYQETASFP